MTRSLIWLPATMLVLVLCAPRLADAQGMSAMITQNGQTLTIGTKIWIHEDNNVDLVQPATLPTSLQHYFNYAHCVCGEPGVASADFHETTFAQEIDSTGGTPYHIPLELWVGADCMTSTNRPLQCTDTGVGISDISTLETTGFTKPEISVYQLMTPVPGNSTCTQQVLSAAEWGLASAAMTGMPDTFLSNAIDTDSQPPPIPTSFNASGAENAIEISWSAATGNVADVASYQVLCADQNGAPAFATPPITPRYQTPRTLCGHPEDVCLTASFVPADVDAGVAAGVVADGGVPDDAGVGTGSCAPTNLPVGLAQLDPSYLCGEVVDPTATSLRVGGLQNGTGYTVVLLTIDLSGNAAGTYFTSPLTPKPVTDFWEDLHERGSKVEGGFCLVAETFGDDNPLTGALRGFRDDNLAASGAGRWIIRAYYATLAKLGAIVRGHLVLRVISALLLAPLVAVALLWHLLTLPGLLVLGALVILFRKFRKHARRLLHSRALASATALALVVLAPHLAHAQEPYWDAKNGDDGTSMADVPGTVTWHAGIRLGPYTPGIDAQSGVTNMAGQGPYKAMFGGYSIMPMLDLDRIVWTGFGQLGFGVGLGYISKTAHAWIEGSDPNLADRPRSDGDTNSFHLLPIQLTAVYRFSWFDDEYGVPIVPYVRGGLGYYIWWVSAPNGDFAIDPMNASNKADGASAGLVGSIGLAVRAERIDSDAARSMRDGGIEHAGFYGEVSAGWIDGFGSQTKLSVGDTTWFAGIDFEF